MKGDGNLASLNNLGGIHYEMMKRCYNPKSVMWDTYGALGIKVCEEWHNRDKFKEWARQNGYEKRLRLQRYDSTKDYRPENCYFGDKLKAKGGFNQKAKIHARITKRRKEELGLKRYSDSRLFNIHGHMIARCYNPNDAAYANYGGRGIRVCDEWRAKGGEGIYNFIKWAKNNGWLELEDCTIQTLDRIDPNGNYYPENCRFITIQEQQRNKRNTVKHEYNGLILTLRQIALMEEIPYSKLLTLVNKNGMELTKAINTLIGTR